MCHLNRYLYFMFILCITWAVTMYWATIFLDILHSLPVPFYKIKIKKILFFSVGGWLSSAEQFLFEAFYVVVVGGSWQQSFDGFFIHMWRLGGQNSWVLFSQPFPPGLSLWLAWASLPLDSLREANCFKESLASPRTSVPKTQLYSLQQNINADG